MRRGWIVTALLAAGALFGARAQQAADVKWIWFDDGEPGNTAPAENRFFRRAFDLPASLALDEARLEITADNFFTVWVNGVKVGSGDAWTQLYQFDVKKHLKTGKNVIAVEAGNESPGPAALLVRLTYKPAGQPARTLVSDKQWKSAKTGPQGWEKPDFDDGKWTATREIAALGAGPWGNVGGGVAGKETPRKITVPEGFRVEQAVKRPDDRGPFSLVNLCFDAKGRLLLSQENGPILLCTEPDKEGVYQKVVEYCTQVKNNQGMCCVGDALYLVGNGPQGTGLYRCRDADGDDKIDDVKVIHKFQGGMGEHGPHAVVHGPDGWLYVVVGNHAWAQLDKLADNSPLTRWPKGTQGPDQGKANTTEDVLLPRLNDANGHAANIRAPGGTIWRMDLEGKNVSLVSAGYRNQYDAAFTPLGELFSYDSDMEWDEGLPWYRAVRVCHATPGSDFVWRTGAANTPNYYLDSLPPLYETGRGSPVGVECYDHSHFSEMYRGALFLCDWSVGIIYAVRLKRDGATFKPDVEKFCTGNPLNVTDCAVGPDGALYFTLGGRGSQGGVQRIVYPRGRMPDMVVQPQSAWGRAKLKWYHDQATKAGKAEDFRKQLIADVRNEDGQSLPIERIGILNGLQQLGMPADLKLLAELLKDKEAEVRAHAVWLIGVNGYKDGKNDLAKALRDDDPFVRRRACEALVRAGIEPPLRDLGPLLIEKDRFVRTAARLVLQRIEPKKWIEALWVTDNHRLLREGIVAMCKTHQAEEHAERIFGRLHEMTPGEDTDDLLDHLRTLQLAMVHTSKRPGSLRGAALDCLEMFPHKDARVNRELAILLAGLRKESVIDNPVGGKLLDELLKTKDDRPQQIHYFYCLRLLHEGSKPEERLRLLTWYEGTKTWKGGASYTGFLENILKDFLPAFSADDVKTLLAKAEELPRATSVVLRGVPADKLPRATALVEAYHKAKATRDVATALLGALGRSVDAEAPAALRKIADVGTAELEAVALAFTRNPSAENWPYLIRGLGVANKQGVFEILTALRGAATKPKADDPAPFRAVLLASGKLDPPNRWRAVEVLRHWTAGREFGADKGDWRSELGSWTTWFSQAFPKESKLPNIVEEKPPELKYKYEELLTFLDKDGKTGDAKKGRMAFEKGLCLKCHKFGNEGDSIGPDLTTVKSRFKRGDVLEALYYPSKVISDQYRSTQIVTKKGQTLVGLVAVQGDTVTVLQSDGMKVAVKGNEVDQRFSSLMSVMPEKLLDQLTKQEIADLFAYLESEPPK